MARHNRPNGFFVVGEAHGFIVLVDFLKRRSQNFSIKTRYVHARDRLLLADIDYRVTGSGEHRLSFIDYRLYTAADGPRRHFSNPYWFVTARGFRLRSTNNAR